MTHTTSSRDVGRRVACALATIAVCLGCDSSPAKAGLTETTELVDRLIDTSSAVLPDPSTESQPDFQLGRLGTAVMVGARIAMLDMLPPHVKVYDRDGLPVASFLSNGEGPGQMRMPVAMARWDDSTVVIADVSGRLAQWTLDGQLVTEGTGLPGLPVMGLVRCGGNLVLYGPSRDSDGSTEWTWLRTVGSDLETVVTSGMRESIEAGEVHGVGGRIYGIHASGDTVLRIRHQFGPTPGVVQVGCTDLSLRGRMWNLAASPRMPRPAPGGGPVAPPKLTGPRPAGMAHYDNLVLLADLLVSTSETDPDSTRFTVLGGQGTDSVDVPGRHQLLGSGPAGVLVMTNDPRQGVRVVSTP